MAEPWICAQCGTSNDPRTLTCGNCGTVVGSAVTPAAATPTTAAATPTSTPTWAPTTDPPATGAAAGQAFGFAATDGDATTSGWATAGGQPPGEPAGPPQSSWNVGAPAPGGPASVPPLWRRIPAGLVILLVLVVGGGVVGLVLNAGRASTGEINREGDMMATDLRVGDCFDFKDVSAEEITDVTAKPCTAEHEYELIYTDSMPSGDYPSDDTFNAFVEANCLPAFDAYVGLAYADSALDVSWLVPLPDAWNGGDKSVQCSVYDPENKLLIGSLKSSRR